MAHWRGAKFHPRTWDQVCRRREFAFDVSAVSQLSDFFSPPCRGVRPGHGGTTGSGAQRLRRDGRKTGNSFVARRRPAAPSASTPRRTRTLRRVRHPCSTGRSARTAFASARPGCSTATVRASSRTPATAGAAAWSARRARCAATAAAWVMCGADDGAWHRLPDLATSTLNCGNCGHACGSNQRCESSSCVDIRRPAPAAQPAALARPAARLAWDRRRRGQRTGHRRLRRGSRRHHRRRRPRGHDGQRGLDRGQQWIDRQRGATGTGGTRPPVMTLVPPVRAARLDQTGTMTASTRNGRGDGQRRHHDADLGGLRRIASTRWAGTTFDAQRGGQGQGAPAAVRRRWRALRLGRIPIGASDYAMDRYTLDEVSSGTDPTWPASRSLATGEAHPVHQGGAGREGQHPLLGQPVDAAHLDEDQPSSPATRSRLSTAAP